MPRVPDVRDVVTQLHDVAPISQHEQRCDGVSDLQWSAGCEEIHWKQNASPWLRAEWNCNKLAVKLLVIPGAPVITPHDNR
jgi:hypothetical protein